MICNISFNSSAVGTNIWFSAGIHRALVEKKWSTMFRDVGTVGRIILESTRGRTYLTRAFCYLCVFIMTIFIGYCVFFSIFLKILKFLIFKNFVGRFLFAWIFSRLVYSRRALSLLKPINICCVIFWVDVRCLLFGMHLWPKLRQVTIV